MGIVDTAKSLIGKVSYVFGADSITSDGGSGDCSSFTQYVFSQSGIDIGRTTESQWSKGMSVEKADLKEGDLIFFKDTYPSGYKDGVSHVGIYIGDGQFIHNSSGDGGVVVASLDNSYYTNHYLGAKRMNGHSTSIGSIDEVSTKKDLKWWGDLLVVILTVLLIGACVLFFMSAFGGIPKPTTLKMAEKLTEGSGN